jgi:gliding motility-associatede transport system auxiliary component
MRRSSNLAGIIGLVLLIFGLVDYFIARGFLFFVLVNIVLGVLAIVVWITSSRDALSGLAGHRAARYGANAVLYSAAFIGILVAINYLGTVYHRRVDTTAEKVFSLSPQSVKIVKSLKKPLKLYGFVEAGVNPTARSLYESYAYASPKVSFELVDPDKHPELAEKYKVSVMNTTHIQYGGDTGEGTNVTEMTEQAITNAIIKVTKAGRRVIYFLDGHGEADPDDSTTAGGFAALRKALEGEGYEVKKLLLATKPSIPSDCTILVVAGPTRPLMPHEIEQMQDYLKKGGRMLVMLRPERPDQPMDESALIKLVGDWGVKAGNDVVVDQVVRLFAGPALGLDPLVDTYGAHPITRDFKQRTVFPMTRSVEPDSSKPGLTVTALAKTSPTSWAETDLTTLFRDQKAELDPTDQRGPITVCDAVDANLKKLKLGDGDARLVVFGDTEFGDNQHLNDFFNRDFFVNAADWLAGEENQISIRPRSIRASRFRLTVDQFAVVFALSVLLLPELLLIAGIVVWWERRS